MSPVILQSTQLALPPHLAFSLFSDAHHLERWLARKARVEAVQGGPFELFWRPDDPENDSTIGCRVLAVNAPHFINFEWKGPQRFSHFMNDVQPLTNVMITFHPVGSHTLVTLIHTGWREYGEWHLAVSYFTAAWASAFETLESYSLDLVAGANR